MANFARRNNNPSGVYQASYKQDTDEMGQPRISESIIITGREVYSTDDKKKIDFLRNDPEIIELDKRTKIEVNDED